VALAFGPFAVVVGPGRRVVQGREGREEQRAFEFLVPRLLVCSPRMDVPERG
jgi:hypothetical protein